MTLIQKRTYSIGQLPADSGVTDYPLVKGQIETGVVIHVPYAVNVTGAGSGVRARSIPIKRVSLIGDGKNAIQSWRARDLIAIAQIFEQTPLAGLVTPAADATVANKTGLICHIPLMFKLPGKIQQADKTDLPTFGYQNLTLRVEWGSVSDLFTDGGTLAGAITFGSPSNGVGGVQVTQLDIADFPIGSVEQARAVIAALDVNVARYVEITQAAAANTAFPADLGTTEDFRGMLICSELASTGEPTDTIINTVGLRENNKTMVYEGLPWLGIKADNSKHFGLTMPTGYSVIDFAEDGAYDSRYRARSKTKVEALFNTAAVAGTIRVALLGIDPRS